MQSLTPSDLNYSPHLNHVKYRDQRPFTGGESVIDLCEGIERDIADRIQNMPDHTILASDKETHFTKLVNTYLSDDNTDYAKLNVAEATLQARSNATHVEILYRIPWTGRGFAFLFKATEDFGKPSDEVAISANDSWKVIAFYYRLPKDDDTKQFQSTLQKLLKNDVSWVVNSLDNVIHHFQEHEEKLREIMGRELDQRIRSVVSVQGLVEDVEIPESIFESRLSVDETQVSSSKRNPRYNVFRPYLYGQQEGRCKGTGQEIYYSQSSVDHIVPKSKGGKDELDNLAIMCQPCNNLKDDGTWEEYMEKIKANPSICEGYEEPKVDE